MLFSLQGKRVLRNYTEKQIPCPGSPAAVLCRCLQCLCQHCAAGTDCGGCVGWGAGREGLLASVPSTDLMQPLQLLEAACCGLTGKTTVFVDS